MLDIMVSVSFIHGSFWKPLARTTNWYSSPAHSDVFEFLVHTKANTQENFFMLLEYFHSYLVSLCFCSNTTKPLQTDNLSGQFGSRAMESTIYGLRPVKPWAPNNFFPPLSCYCGNFGHNSTKLTKTQVGTGSGAIAVTQLYPLYRLQSISNSTDTLM